MADMTPKEALKLLNDMEFADKYQGKDEYTNMLLVCKNALEKQIPKKVMDIHVDEYYCPACGAENNKDYSSNSGDNYCPDCGQALDWSDRDE